jgi:hypothetical protein
MNDWKLNPSSYHTQIRLQDLFSARPRQASFGNCNEDSEEAKTNQ